MITWNEEDDLNDQRITIFSDNEAVVHMINNTASSCERCMKLIQILALDNIVHNRKINCRHILSEDNILSDALSCLDFNHFWKNAPKTICSAADNVTALMWPVNQFWSDKNYLNRFL